MDNNRDSILAILDKGADSKIAPLLSAWNNDGFVTHKAHDLEEADDLFPIQNLKIIVVLSYEIDYTPFIAPFTKIRKVPVLVLPYDGSKQSHTDAVSEATKIFIHYMGQDHDTFTSETKKVGNILIDFNQRKVFVQDVEITLSKLEFNLLSELASAPNRVFKFGYLYTAVWGEAYLETPDVLHDAVKRIRKSCRDENELINIENVRGVGYRLVVPEEDTKIPVIKCSQNF